MDLYMITKLIYFDNKENSDKGLLRGLVMMPSVMVSVYVIMILLQHTFKYKNKRNIKPFVIFLISVIIVSAIGVQDEDNINNVVVYNGLVFFVIYGVLVLHIIYFHKNVKYLLLLFILLISIGLGMLNGYISHKIAPKFI